MFSKIGSLKNFAIFKGKHLCWGIFLRRLQAFRPATFFRKRFQHRWFLWILRNFVRTAFFIEHLRWLLLTVLQQYSKVSWGFCYSLISRLHVFSILIRNLHKTFHKYYHVAKQCLPCLN